MSLLLAIIVGIIVGLAGGFLLPENIDHVIINVAVGISGGLIGLILCALLRSVATTALIDPASIVSSAIGALVLVLGFNGLHAVMPTRATHIETPSEDEIAEIESTKSS